MFATSGKNVDLFTSILEVNIFEDVFASTMTGNITVGDTVDLINFLPITGFEYIVMGFQKPSNNETFTKVFRIYKLTARRKENQQTEVYVLNFCSEELIVDRSTLVSKTYTGLPIHKMVQDITKSYLKIDKTKLDETQVKDTFGNHNIIIPHWHPLDAIRYLSKIATSSQYPSSSFVFFENQDGFHFTSLEELSTVKPIQKITVSPRNFGVEQDAQDPDIKLSFESAFDYDIDTDFDILTSVSSGMYAGRLVSVNPLRQRIDQTTVDLTGFFAKTKHLNAHPNVSSLNTRSGKPLNKLPDSFLRVYPTTLGHDKLKPDHYPNQVEKWLLQRSMYLANLNAYKFTLSIPGNFELKAGKVVDVLFPALTLADKTEKPLDKFHSGHYLITAIRHSFNKYQHVSYLELARESSESPYPDGLNTNPGMEKLKSL